MTNTSAYYVAEEVAHKYKHQKLQNLSFPAKKYLDHLTTAAQIFTILSYVYVDYCIACIKDMFTAALDASYKSICLLYDKGKDDILFLPSNVAQPKRRKIEELNFASFGLKCPENMKDEDFITAFSSVNRENSQAFKELQHALFYVNPDTLTVATLTNNRLHWKQRPDYNELFISERVFPKILSQASDLLFLHTKANQSQDSGAPAPKATP